MGNNVARRIKQQLKMQPHPCEGGHYVRTYESPITIELPMGSNSKAERRVATAIYYLLESHEKSIFHILLADEMWHFYQGDPVTIIEITPRGQYKETTIGRLLQASTKPQYLVRANNHFAAYIKNENQQHGYGLVGCNVFPGFDFADYSISNKNQLLELAPDHADKIEMLT